MTRKRLRLFRPAKVPKRSDGVGQALQQAYSVPDEGDEAMLRLIERLKAFEGGGHKPKGDG